MAAFGDHRDPKLQQVFERRLRRAFAVARADRLQKRMGADPVAPLGKRAPGLKRRLKRGEILGHGALLIKDARLKLVYGRQDLRVFCDLRESPRVEV